MIAASFWSLLAPAIELAVTSGMYGAKGEFAFVPVAGGFLLGSIFVFATDKVISYLGINSPHMMIGTIDSHLYVTSHISQLSTENVSHISDFRFPFDSTHSK